MEIIKAEAKYIVGIMGVWDEFMESQRTAEPDWDPGTNARQQLENYLSKNLVSRNDLILVAVEAANVVGFSIAVLNSRHSFFKRAKRWGTITDLAIMASHRSKGIGRSLLAQTLAWFRENGIPVVEVSVLAGNQTGVEFWEKNGFKPFSHRLYRPIMDF
jgi:ribosomal protein S18 acetylase RimI-like enzyme